MTTTPYAGGHGHAPRGPDQHILLELDRSKRDIHDLKSLAGKLNKKLETEMVRTRQLQEDIVLANANMRNMIFQNEDLRERIIHIEAYGVEQHHQHTVKVKHQASSAEIAMVAAGIVAVVSMVLLMALTVVSLR